MPSLADSRQIMSLRANLSWNFLGQLIAKVSLLIFHIVFANLVGIEGYGAFSFVFVGGLILLQPALDLGLNQLITKWVSRGNTEVVRLSFRIKGLTALGLIPLVFVIGWWKEISFLLLLTVLGFFLINTLQQSLFGILRGLKDLRPESLTVALQNMLACAVLGFFVFQQIAEPWLGALILMLTRFTGTIFVSAIIWKKYLSNLKNFKNDTLMLESTQLWREAVTLGFVLFLIQFYFRIDTIMLGILASETEVGLYSVAFNLMEGTFFIPTIVMAAIFPGLSQAKHFSAYFRKGVVLLTLTGIAGGATVFLLADSIILWFYAPEFQNSADILEILALAIPLVFWGYLMTQSLVALDHNRIYLVITATGLLLNVLLNFWLIPEYGASGAAFSTVITEALIPLSCLPMILKYHFSQSPANVT
ncbi:flippase [Deltaproteobacteria bacterium]|nr:flippase [Deltaproteobacteria bacterium]